jgi:transposase-like protein
MPRHFTADEKEQALQLLADNRGDVARTAAQLGINPRTLYAWRKRADVMPVNLTNLKNFPHESAVIASDDVEALRNLQQEMLHEAYNLVHSIEEAIDDAPLNQRVAALAQLIDRIIKLSVQLPHPEDDVQIAYHRESYEQDDDPFDEAASESTEDSR